MRCWTGKYTGRTAKTLVETVERLKPEQIAQNTTWTVTKKGIVQPGNSNHVLPLGYFLRNNVPHKPSKEVAEALALSKKLLAKAAAKGKKHWSQLPNKELPDGWMARVRKSQGKVEKSEDNSEGEESEESEEEGVTKKTQKKTQKKTPKNTPKNTRGSLMKRKVETPDESSDDELSEIDSSSGEEPCEQHEEEMANKKTPQKMPTIIMKRKLIESEESGEEGNSKSKEGVKTSRADRMNKRLKTAIENPAEDQTKGNTPAATGPMPASKKTVAGSDSSDSDSSDTDSSDSNHDDGRARPTNTGRPLRSTKRKVVKRKVVETSDDSSLEDIPMMSKRVKVSHPKGNTSDVEPLNTANSQQKQQHHDHPSSDEQRANTTLDNLTAQEIQDFLEAQPWFTPQMRHELLSRQHKFTAEELAFIFADFTPTTDLPPMTQPHPTFVNQNPLLSGQRYLYPIGPIQPSRNTAQHPASPASHQPTMGSHLADTPAMPPPSPPSRILQSTPLPPTSNTSHIGAGISQIGQAPLAQNNAYNNLPERANRWVKLLEFLEQEQRRLKDPNVCTDLSLTLTPSYPLFSSITLLTYQDRANTYQFDPRPSREDDWYGAYDRPWYLPKPELSVAEKVNVPRDVPLHTNSSFFHPLHHPSE